MVQYDFVYNRKKRLGRDGKALVQLRCYLNGRTKFYSTEVRVKPEHWDKSRQHIKKLHPKAPILNRMIREKMEKYEQFELDMITR